MNACLVLLFAALTSAVHAQTVPKAASQGSVPLWDSIPKLAFVRFSAETNMALKPTLEFGVPETRKTEKTLAPKWSEGSLELTRTVRPNWVEEVIIGSNYISETYFTGTKRHGADQFELGMPIGYGKKWTLSWFVDNYYPARTGQIGKDIWASGGRISRKIGGSFR